MTVSRTGRATCSSDMLPGDPAPDVSDRGVVDAEALGERSLGKVWVCPDVTDVGFSELRVPIALAVRVSAIFGFIFAVLLWCGPAKIGEGIVVLVVIAVGRLESIRTRAHKSEKHLDVNAFALSPAASTQGDDVITFPIGKRREYFWGRAHYAPLRAPGD